MCRRLWFQTKCVALRNMLRSVRWNKIVKKRKMLLWSLTNAALSIMRNRLSASWSSLCQPASFCYVFVDCFNCNAQHIDYRCSLVLWQQCQRAHARYVSERYLALSTIAFLYVSCALYHDKISRFQRAHARYVGKHTLAMYMCTFVSVAILAQVFPFAVRACFVARCLE